MPRLYRKRNEIGTVVRKSGVDIEAAVVRVRSGKFGDETLREAGAVTLYDDAAAHFPDPKARR
jgi:hypothetical protein